ncbi:MAG: DUF4124 domain-containing protein [Gammaproteobacteria bacterium]|nr:DUF4124 domain-containing protein [Gammaproteobacteria bacterium]
MRKLFLFVAYLLLAAVMWQGYRYLTEPDYDVSAEVNRKLEKLLPDELIKTAPDTKVYRWKDTQGHWHYSDEKPQVEPLELKVIEYQRELAQMKSIIDEHKQTKADNEKSSASTVNVTEIFERASKLDQLLRERQQKIDQQINQ